jgi:hypothetical protein
MEGRRIVGVIRRVRPIVAPTNTCNFRLDAGVIVAFILDIQIDVQLLVSTRPLLFALTPVLSDALIIVKI